MAGEEQTPDRGRQRLDKWLFFTRLLKSRALAQKRIEDGDISVNGRAVSQPSQMVRAGDLVDIRSWRGMSRHVQIIRVLKPGERRGPFEEARTLYEDCGAREDG